MRFSFGSNKILVSTALAFCFGQVAYADARLEGFESNTKLPSRYIVILKDSGIDWRRADYSRRDEARFSDIQAVHEHNRNLALQHGRELAAKFKGGLTWHYGIALKGFAVRMTEANARKMAADDRVEAIVADQPTTINTSQTPVAWHLDRIDQESYPLNNIFNFYSTGSFPIPNPQHVASSPIFVLDSGVSVTHNEFGGRAARGWNYAGTNNDGTPEGGIDCNGHATHVAALIAGTNYGVAKQAQITSITIVGCDSNGTTSDMIQGIEKVTSLANVYGLNGSQPVYINGIRYYKPVIGHTSVSGPASSAVDLAITTSINAGVTWVVSAGNDKHDACNNSPGRASGVITVASSNDGDSPSNSFTNYGACISLFAPGEHVNSAWPFDSLGSKSDSKTKYLDGTSMAAPLVTGVVALYLASNPASTPAQVKAAIISAAWKSKLTGDLKGSPNLLLSSVVPGNTATTSPPPGLNPKQKAAAMQVLINYLLAN